MIAATLLSAMWCPVPVRESVLVRSVPCEREGKSLGSLRNIGECRAKANKAKRATRPERQGVNV